MNKASRDLIEYQIFLMDRGVVSSLKDVSSTYFKHESVLILETFVSYDEKDELL
jgi:hypothetical protein